VAKIPHPKKKTKTEHNKTKQTITNGKITDCNIDSQNKLYCCFFFGVGDFSHLSRLKKDLLAAL
jgi:hypothetical protein